MAGAVAVSFLPTASFYVTCVTHVAHLLVCSNKVLDQLVQCLNAGEALVLLKLLLQEVKELVAGARTVVAARGKSD